MRSRALLFTIFFLIASLTPVAAAQTTEPNRDNDEWIEATLAVEQPDLTTLQISGTLLVRKFVVEGTSYETADDIARAYQQLKQAGQDARADEFVQDMEESTTASLRASLERDFPNADVTVELADLDRSTLAPPSGDPYAPGILLNVTAVVVRSLEDVGLQGLSLDAAAAVFDAGAIVRTELPLSASAGHHVTYVVSPPATPDDLRFAAPEPADVASVDEDALVVVIDNAAASTAREITVTADLFNPAAVDRVPSSEHIVAEIEIALGALEEGATAIPVDATVAANIHAIDVAARFPDALPSSVTLPFLSSEALSALYATGAIVDADLEQAGEELKGTLTENLEAVMEDVVVTEPGFDTDAMADGAAAPFTTDTPVQFTAVAEGSNPLPAGGEDADLALDLGATLDVDLELPASKDQDTVVTVRAPPGSVFANAEGGVLSADGAMATFEVPADPAEAVKAVKLALRGVDAPTYTAEDAASGSRFHATLDLQELDMSVTKAAGGDFGQLLGEVLVRVEMGVFEIPPEFKSSLPEGVDLTYLDSDALRTLRERGLITDAQLQDLEEAFRENVTANLRDALQVDVDVTGGLVTGTMTIAGGSAPSGDSPVVLEARATFAKPLAGGGEAPPTTAAALYSMPQSFKLPSVQGFPTTYKVILPRGLAVTDMNVQSGTAETGSENGRDYFIVEPEGGSEATATMSIAVTPTFVVVQFWYVLLVALVLLALPVAVPLAVRARRKRKAQE